MFYTRCLKWKCVTDEKKIKGHAHNHKRYNIHI